MAIRRLAAACLILAVALAASISGGPVEAQLGGPAVITQHNNRQRTGINDLESTLTPGVIAHGRARRMLLPVIGQVYAQPLYLPRVQIGVMSHKAVFVATMRNNVYAFDAENYSALWARNVGCPVLYDLIRLNLLSNGGYNIHDAVGILSTPVIDDSGHYMYFVARVDLNATGQSPDPAAANCHSDKKTADVRYFLHKIDVTTGADATPPQRIDAQLGKAQLDPRLHLQRPGLLLVNKSIYVAFGSSWDTGTWHGWILRFGADRLDVQQIFCTTPAGKGGGIWQAGSGLAANEDGDVIFMSGNGTTEPEAELSTAFVQLTPDLNLRHYFVPDNKRWLNLVDLDSGSAGPVVLPDGGVLGGGKEGRLYILAPRDLSTRPFDLLASLQVTGKPDAPFIPPASYRHIHGTPVAWPLAPDRVRLFVWGERDPLQALTYVYSPKPEIVDRAWSNLRAPAHGMPGGILSFTINGAERDTAILWASLPTADAFVKDVPGVLLAIDPNSLTRLWSNVGEDYLFAKYCPPTVVDGKVFLATLSGWLLVYDWIAP